MHIRKVKANEMDQTIQLADEIFRREGHSSMDDAFSHVFTQGMNHSFGAFAFDGGKLISFMGLVPSIIKIGEAEVNVFSIAALWYQVSNELKLSSPVIITLCESAFILRNIV